MIRPRAAPAELVGDRLQLSPECLSALPQPSVDTGMGLERLLMVTQDVPSVFETDLFTPWLSAIGGLWHPAQRSLRILSDHLRSASVIISAMSLEMSRTAAPSRAISPISSCR